MQKVEPPDFNREGPFLYQFHSTKPGKNYIDADINTHLNRKLCEQYYSSSKWVHGSICPVQSIKAVTSSPLNDFAETMFTGMKLMFLYFLLFISYTASGQEIEGKWVSGDGTRIYNIYKRGDQFEAELEKSSRRNDKEGAMILRRVRSRNNKKVFNGEIYSVDGYSTLTKIRFKENGQVLRLRLRRMFFMNVTIKWYRVVQSSIN